MVRLKSVVLGASEPIFLRCAQCFVDRRHRSTLITTSSRFLCFLLLNPSPCRTLARRDKRKGRRVIICLRQSTDPGINDLGLIVAEFRETFTVLDSSRICKSAVSMLTEGFADPSKNFQGPFAKPYSNSLGVAQLTRVSSKEILMF